MGLTRNVAPLLPDWLLAPAASRKLEQYIGGLINKTLAMKNDELRLKDPAARTLVEDLALEQTNKKVNLNICCSGVLTTAAKLLTHRPVY